VICRSFLEETAGTTYTDDLGRAMTRPLFFLLFFLGCATSAQAQQERLRVVATTTDLRALVKVVGAEQVIVSSLVPADERVEEYQPRLQDTAILKGARVIVRAGSGIDPWFDKLLARAAQKNGPSGIERGEPGHLDASLAVANLDPLAVSAGFARTRRGSRFGSTPHYWLDPKAAEAITAQIAETLGKLDPANKKYFETNREAFLQRLNGKLREWSARLAPLQGQPLIAFHDDWEFFARRFGLNFIDFIATRDRAPPRRGKMAALEKIIPEKGVRLIVSEAKQPERHAARLATRTSAKLVELAGSVGAVPNTDDYIAMFDFNVNALVAAFDRK
jgi:ABC-type Zn uptake system ZnuABC Zn-binding protein ZnuA